MRTKLLLAAAATFVTLSAGAAPNGPGQSLDAGRVDIVGAQPKQTQMAPLMFDKVQGDYALDDGRTLTVTGKVNGHSRKLYADLGDGPTEIVHVGKNRFVAMDRDLRLSFDQPDVRKLPNIVRITSLAGRTVALAQR